MKRSKVLKKKGGCVKHAGSKACKGMEIACKYLKVSILPEQDEKVLITLEKKLLPLREQWFC